MSAIKYCTATVECSDIIRTLLRGGVLLAYVNP